MFLASLAGKPGLNKRQFLFRKPTVCSYTRFLGFHRTAVDHCFLIRCPSLISRPDSLILIHYWAKVSQKCSIPGTLLYNTSEESTTAVHQPLPWPDCQEPGGSPARRVQLRLASPPLAQDFYCGMQAEEMPGGQDENEQLCREGATETDDLMSFMCHVVHTYIQKPVSRNSAPGILYVAGQSKRQLLVQ